MTPQQVIKSFMAKLVDHGYSYSDSIGTAILDYGVQGSSDFSNVQAVIDAMKADQKQAEKEAVEEVLGSNYAGKTLSEVSANILSADAKNYDTKNIGNAYYSQSNDRRTTVERLIKERKAIIFLEKYCGIQLANKYWINSSDAITYWGGQTTGNVDTGAITGSDANITLTAGETFGDNTLSVQDLQVLKTKYGTAASLSSDGKSIVIGTGVEKTDRSVVPEIGNKYTATTSGPQNINTGSNDWIVVATSGNDTITTGGADSVNASAGNDKIYVGKDYASILTGAGSDSVEISAEVKNVTLGDLNSSDVLKISGTFEVGSAKIEDTLLVITDKSGSRKIRLGDFDNAKNAKINSTTIGNWLNNAGIDLNNLQMTGSNNDIYLGNQQVTNSSNDSPISGTTGGDGQVAIDPNYTPSTIYSPPDDESSDVVHRSSNSTGEINVNLDNVTLTGGNLNLDGNKVGEISNEFPHITSFTKNGLTINLIGTTTNNDGYPSNFENKTFDQLTDDQKTIVAGIFKWWGKECLQINEESYGISFNSSTAQVKEIGLYFYDGNGSSNTLATVWNWSTAGTGQNTTKLMLNINVDYYNGMAEDNLDGQSSKSSAGLLDRTLAHEFTHALMATNMHYFNSLPKFIKEGMAELTHGIDDFRPTNIFKIAYDDDWLDASLDLGNKGTGSQNIGDGYSGGYMFLRYFAKQSAMQSILDELASPVNPLLITLTENADTYTNTLSGATIQALGGNDKIKTSLAANVSIDGGAGNDSLYALGEKVTLNGGIGNDTLENLDNVASKGSMLLGSAGTDYVKNYGNESFVDGGADNDTIYNYANASTVIGGTGNDTVYNYGASVSVEAGEGSDYIYSNGSNPTIFAGAGNDTIDNRATINSKLDGGADNDFIKSTASNSTIDGGTGNDTISNNKGGSNTSIIGGAGNDSLKNLSYNSYVTMLGGDSDDTIINAGLNAQLIGGKGNDLINLSGSNNLIQYTSGDGNDSIVGFNTTASLKIGNGTNADTYSKSTIGSDILVSVGSGVITLSNAASLSTVNILGKEVDTTPAGVTINNSTNSTLITSGAGNDSIYNSGNSVTIDSGAGDDYLYNNRAGVSNAKLENKVTLNGGAGNDTIDGVYFYSSVNSGTGNDYIKGTGYGSTILAGDGNDTVSGDFYSGTSIDSGNGNDFVYSQNYVSVNGGAGDDTVNLNAGGVAFGGEGNDKISFGTLNGGMVNGGKGNDTIYSTTTRGVWYQYASGDGNDVIYGFSGNDTLQITASNYSTLINGKDFIVSIGGNSIVLKDAVVDKWSKIRLADSAGNISIWNDWSVMSGTAGNDTLNNVSNKVTVDGLSGNDSIKNSGNNVTVLGGAGNDSIYHADGYVTIEGGDDDDKITMHGGALNKVFGGAGNDYIYDNYSNTFNTISGGAGNDTIVSYTGSVDGGEGNDVITISGPATAQGGKGNDTIYGVDQTGIFDAKENKRLYKYKSGDGNDLVEGFKVNDTLKIGNGTTDSYSKSTVGSDILVSVGSGVITLSGAASLSAVNILGKEVLEEDWKIITTENNVVTNGGRYKIAEDFIGNITIETAEAVTLDGTDTGELSNVSILTNSQTADLTIRNVKIANDWGKVIKFGTGIANKLHLSGTNILTSKQASVLVNIGGGLTIDGNGALNIETEGVCIGTNEKSTANLSILNGNVKAHVNGYGVYSAIGTGYSSSMGDILIGGNATVEAFGGCYGAGIGSGNYSTVGNIKITDNAFVNTKGNFGAGIGTAYSNGLDKDGKPMAWSTAGNISIDGNATVKSLSNMGAAIGNGSSYSGHTTVGDILIGGNANVEAICAIHDGGIGGGHGTGIGNGYTSQPGSTSTTGNITITDDAQVLAKNYAYGVGLGKGTTEFNNTNIMGAITFSGNTATAVKSRITIANADTSRKVTINGKSYDTKAQLVFVDGALSTEGDNIITNEKQNVSVIGTAGNDTVLNYGSNATIIAYAGDDEVYNYDSSAKIFAGDGNDLITNNSSNVSILADNGNDTINNTGYATTILSGSSNDAVYNFASNISIDTGLGDDVVEHFGSGSIKTGSGNDSVYTGGHNLLLELDEGDDTVNSHGSNVTINAGKGNDIFVDSGGNQRLFIYNAGDGLDTITGFTSTDSLSISGDTYSTSTSGKNMIVTVGDGKITIIGAASLETLNIIVDAPITDEPVWKIIDGQAIYGTTDEVFFTIYNISSAAKESDFNLSGNEVTIAKNALGEDDVFLEGEGYTLKLANDVPQAPKTTSGTWSTLVNGKATYTAGGYSAYYTLDDNTIIYTPAEGGEEFTLSGIKSISSTAVSVDNENKTVTLFAPALGTDKITLDGDDYSLTLDKAITQDSGVSDRKFISLANSVATYKISGDRAYYTLDGNEVFYTPATADKQFTISGLASNLTLSNGKIDGVSVVVNEEEKSVKFTLSAKALKDSDVTLAGTGATLELATDVPKTAKDIPEEWSEVVNGTASYSTNGKSKYYTLSNNKVIYNAPVEGTLQIKLKGLSISATTLNGKIAGITVSEKSLTISGTVVGKNVELEYNNGFNINLASDVKNISFTGTSDVDSISNQGYSVSIAGGAGNDSIYNYGDSVSIDGGVGNDSIRSYKPQVTINGGDGDDYIYTHSDRVSINGGTGSDSIYNYFGDSVTIDGGDGDDYIFIQSDRVSINGGAGSDSIYNYFDDSVTIDGGDGDDYITNHGESVSINGGADNDYIDNIYTYVWNSKTEQNEFVTPNDCTIDGGAGDDSITNHGESVSIDGGDGDDYIYTHSDRVSINGGAGEDDIQNYGDEIKIIGDSGNDTITNYGESVSIDGGVGNDSIFNDTASSVTINTAQGNDTIKLGTSANSFKVDGFAAGDVIELATSETKLETISGGIKAGNVSISGITDIATVNNSWSTSTNSIAYNQSTVAGAKLSGTKITYDASSGTESLFTINGIKSTVGVSLSGKEITLNNAALNGVTSTVSISGGDYKLKLASNVDTIAENTSGWTTLTGGNVAYLEGGKGSYYALSKDGKSITYNASVAGTNKVEFSGVKGNPTLNGNTVSLTANNFNSNVNVVSNTGDYQFALSGAFSSKKFTGTDEADIILNSGSQISIDAGTGNDKITNSGSNVTLTGGAGNDVFSYSKGNFKITDYTASADKISFDIAKVEDVALTNKDVILSLGQSDSITIESGKDKKITVAKDKTAQYIFDNHVILNSGKTATTLTSAATNFDAAPYSSMVTIDATKAKSATKITGNAKANKIFAGDNGSTFTGGKGNDSLYGGAGVDIFVYENQTGNDVIYNYTSRKDKISLGAGASFSNFSVNKDGDALLKIGSNNLKLKKADNENIFENGKEITIIDATGNETTKTYFTNRTVSGQGVTLNSDYVNSFTANSGIVTVDANQSTNPLVLNGNNKNNILTGGKGNDSLLGDKGNDSLTGGDGKNVFIYKAGKDLITDYTAGQDKIKIASGKISKTTLKGSNVVFTIGSGSLTVKDAKGKTISLIDSSNKVSSTVVGAQTLTNNNKASVAIGNDMGVVNASKRTKAIKITGNALANAISGGSKNDTLHGAAGNDSILGNAGNDKLYGDAGNDQIFGGKGNDSLSGDKGNDSLTGGDGKDVFIYKAGKDIITDYKAGQDKIQIADGKISKTTLKGSNVVFTIGSGSLTVKDAKGKTISLIDSSNKVSSTVVGAQTLTNNNKASVAIGNDMGVVNASKRTKAIKITGNALANTISGGSKNDTLYGAAGNDSILGNAGNDKLYGDAGNDQIFGGKGNDSLWGGKGNDSLWGDAGADNFFYSRGNGKDVIFGFDDKDTLTLDNLDFTPSYSASKGTITFKVDGGSVTLKDFTATTFHVNDTTYQISGSKFVKK